MRKLLLFLIFLIFIFPVFSQSDLLVLKQRNQTIQTWVPESFINFQFSSKQWIQGIIKNIRNDSIIMEQIVLQRVANRFGFPTIDTAKMGLLKIHVREIYGMPKRNFSTGIISNGALFKLGSGGYIFLNIFNSVIHNQPLFSSQNLTNLGIASGVFALGALLQARHKTYVVLGKKYTMRILHTNISNK